MILEMFIVQVPEFIQNLNRHYLAGDYDALGKEAHKAKSSLQIMGMTDLENDMKILIKKTVEGTDAASYPEHIRNFEIQCTGALAEIEAVLSNL
ncbi:MAG TPA: Hpt domain-containing protein [Prolixibacteraceae bacterium]|nr:Hpt domain-containing protein [Prolixibacteraceae bacterium]